MKMSKIIKSIAEDKEHALMITDQNIGDWIKENLRIELKHNVAIGRSTDRWVEIGLLLKGEDHPFSVYKVKV